MRRGRWLYHHDQDKPQSPQFQVKNTAVRITAYIGDPALEIPLQFYVGDGPGDPNGRWEYWARAGRRIAFGDGKLTQLILVQAGYYRLDPAALAALPAGLPTMIWLEDEEGTVDDKTIPVHIIRPHCASAATVTITNPIAVTCEQLAVMAASGQIVPSQWYAISNAQPVIDTAQVLYLQGVRPDAVPTEGLLYAPSVFGDNLAPATIAGPPCQLVRIFDPLNANLFVGFDTISTWNWANRLSQNNEFRNVRFLSIDTRTTITNSTFVGGVLEIEGSTIVDTYLADVTLSMRSSSLAQADIRGSIAQIVSSDLTSVSSTGDITLSFSGCSVEDWRSSMSFIDATRCALQAIELRGSRCRWDSAKNVDIRAFWSSIETSRAVTIQGWTVQSATVLLDHGNSGANYYGHDYKSALVNVVDRNGRNVACDNWVIRGGQVYMGLIQPNVATPPIVYGLHVDGSFVRIFGFGRIEGMHVSHSPVVDISADPSVTTLLPRMYINQLIVESSAVYFYYNRTGLSGAWLDLRNVRISGNSSIRAWYGECIWQDVHLHNCQMIDFGNPFATNNWRFTDFHADGVYLYTLNPQGRDLVSNISATNLAGGYVSYWGAGEHYITEVNGQRTGFIFQDSTRVRITRCTGDYGGYYSRYAVDCQFYYCSVFPRGFLAMTGNQHYAQRCHVYGYMSFGNPSPGNQARMTCDAVVVGPAVTLAVAPSSPTAGAVSLRNSEFFGSGWYSFTFTAPVTVSGLYAHGDNGTVVQTFNANVTSAAHRNF